MATIYDYPSNVPIAQIDATGLNVPIPQDILSGVLEDFREAFGQALNISNLQTPQGYLAQELTRAIVDCFAVFADVINGVDPAYSYGKMQDAIGRIYFISRKPPTYTRVECQLIGVPSTVLSAGVKARTDDGNLFSLENAVTFGTDGTATGWFVADDIGVIEVSAGELSNIVTVMTNWDAVTNESAGITGQPIEGRTTFEYRRKLSVSKNARATSDSIASTVYDLDGVTDVYAIDNPLDTSVETGETDYTLKPHSILVSVVGGDNNAIAGAIWEKKEPGTDTNGNTTITVIDKAVLSNNKPQYQINFLRPATTPVKFNVQIKSSPSLPSDIITQTQNAIISALNGEYETKDRERIGGTIYASSYFAPIYSFFAGMDIVSILIGINTADQNSITLGVDQYPVTDSDNITVELV